MKKECAYNPDGNGFVLGDYVECMVRYKIYKKGWVGKMKMKYTGNNDDMFVEYYVYDDIRCEPENLIWKGENDDMELLKI